MSSWTGGGFAAQFPLHILLEFPCTNRKSRYRCTPSSKTDYPPVEVVFKSQCCLQFGSRWSFAVLPSDCVTDEKVSHTFKGQSPDETFLGTTNIQIVRQLRSQGKSASTLKDDQIVKNRLRDQDLIERF